MQFAVMEADALPQGKAGTIMNRPLKLRLNEWQVCYFVYRLIRFLGMDSSKNHRPLIRFLPLPHA